MRTLISDIYPEFDHACRWMIFHHLVAQIHCHYVDISVSVVDPGDCYGKVGWSVDYNR